LQCQTGGRKPSSKFIVCILRREKLKSCLENSELFLKSDSVLVFTCGRKPNPENPTIRDLILDYAHKHFSSFKFFMAEDFFNAFENEEKLDLMTLEGDLADYSDCIIIILESESAFAELGAFSMYDKLAKIVLAINDTKFKNSDSFIKKGPLEKLNKESKFKPVMYVDFSTILTYMPDIREKLNKIEKKNRKRIKLATLEQYKICDPKIRILFLLDIISFFAPIKLSEVKNILVHLYIDRLKINKASFGHLGCDVEALWAELISKGYIENDGSLQNKGANLRSSSDLILDARFDELKFKIYNIITPFSRKLYKQLNMEVSLLETLGLIKKMGGYYLRKSGDDWLFFDYGTFHSTFFRSSVIVKYNKKFKERCEIMASS